MSDGYARLVLMARANIAQAAVRVDSRHATEGSHRPQSAADPAAADRTAAERPPQAEGSP